MVWATLIRLTVALLLGSAAAAKARSINGFALALVSYRLVPRPLVAAVAVGVVSSEATVAALLLSGVAVKPALVAAAALLATFAVATAVTLRRKASLECGCLGNLARIRLDWWSVATNVGLAAAAAWSATQEVTSAPLPAGNPGPSGMTLVAWLGAVLLVVLYWLVAYARTVIAIMRESSGGLAT